MDPPAPGPSQIPGSVRGRATNFSASAPSPRARGSFSHKIVGGVKRHVRASFGTTLEGSRAPPPLQDSGITRGRARSGERV